MNELVGRQLRQAREQHQITLDQVAADTHIRKHYLEALENGDFGILPSGAQVRGFMRSYADYLGLNANELLEQLKSGSAANTASLDVPTIPSAPPAAAPITGEEQAVEIFLEIGVIMEMRRELLGLSLDDVEGHTHIPVHYLNLIEGGQFDRFPSPAQARGMLGNYTDFLDMDHQALMARYAEALQTRLAATQQSSQPTAEARPKKKKARRPLLPQWLRNIFSADLLIFGTIGIVIIFFTIWGIGRVLNTQANTEVQPTAPSLASVLLPTATDNPDATATLPAVATLESSAAGNPGTELEATLTPTALTFDQGNIQVSIIVLQRTYLRVIADGEVVQDGRVIPGSNLPFTAVQTIEVLTGNGAALRVFYNSEDYGPMGIYGEVINVIYTRQGVITPTATITPTIDPRLITPSPTLPSLLPEETTP